MLTFYKPFNQMRFNATIKPPVKSWTCFQLITYWIIHFHSLPSLPLPRETAFVEQHIYTHRQIAVCFWPGSVPKKHKITWWCTLEWPTGKTAHIQDTKHSCWVSSTLNVVYYKAIYTLWPLFLKTRSDFVWRSQWTDIQCATVTHSLTHTHILTRTHNSIRNSG